MFALHSSGQCQLDARTLVNLVSCALIARRGYLAAHGACLGRWSGFARALHLLSKPTIVERRKIDGYRARIQAVLDDDLRNVQALMDAGRFDQATHALDDIDARYGGLAAPRSLELLHAIDADVTPRR